MTVTLSLETDPAPTDREMFYSLLRDHNLAQAGEMEYLPLTLLLRDEMGAVVGGLDGATYWGWLFVAHLAIAPALRGQDLGTRMLQAAEQEAVRRGCRHAYLDTFSFQALAFYQKQGYTVFGTLDDYPDGHQRHFLRKALDPETDDIRRR